MYVVDLFNNTATGGIEWNVANSLPQLMNNKCKIVVKQVQTELVDTTVPAITIDNFVYFRVIHNINIQSGTNLTGFSNSQVLCLFDTYKSRLTFYNSATTTGHATGTTETECTLFAPNGLPAILTLNRWGSVNTNPPSDDANVDSPQLAWCVRLEITVNPDQD
jgi:hypothetical protein